ncbi:MAG: hypothetical protein LBH91_01375, partial [Prevotellaceae bacterium]|nr:hypothetical protein [Prevotellaceae bacterium]
ATEPLQCIAQHSQVHTHTHTHIHIHINAATNISGYGPPIARLRLTWWRLHAGGGFTNVRAGDTLPNLHKCFCGLPAAITPNRSLGVRHFVP